ncbi:hypothetical protein AHAS_Ahas06G0172400 [Arachis hypogaea]
MIQFVLIHLMTIRIGYWKIHPFLTPEEVDALRNDLANMSIQPTLDDLDDQDNDQVTMIWKI